MFTVFWDRVEHVFKKGIEHVCEFKNNNKKLKVTKKAACIWCGNQQIRTAVTKKHSSKNRVQSSHQ